MKTIVAVPESISREAYVALIASLGLETRDLRALEFRMDGIYAEVIERNPNGRGYVIDPQKNEVVTNRVWIPVVDTPHADDEG